PHQIIAKAFACAFPSQTDPTLIATANDSVTVAGQTTISGSYDEDHQQLTINTYFANTYSYLVRSVTVYVDGSLAGVAFTPDYRQSISATASGPLALSCGATHTIRVVA